MTNTKNPDRLIRTYLRGDQVRGDAEVPDHVYNAIRAGIHETRQRAVIGSLGVPDMNKFLAISLGAAVVVTALVVGATLRGSPGPAPGVEPSAGLVLPALPPDCAELDAGTYRSPLGELWVSVTVPAGWAGGGDQGTLRVEDNFGVGQTPCVMGGASKVEVALVDQVYSDGCTRQDIIATDTPAELTAALAAQTGHQTLGPIETTLDGHPASRFEFSIPDGFDDAAACTGREITGGVYLWPRPDGVGSGAEFHGGEAVTVWVVDVDGTALAVAAFPRSADLDPIMASLRIESSEPTAAPSVSAAPSEGAQSVEPSAAEPSIPAGGGLPEGPFTLWDAPGDVAITVTIPGPGWSGDEGGGMLLNRNFDPSGGAGLMVFQGPLYVYGDACHWSTTTPETPATTTEELTAALEAQTSHYGGPAGEFWNIGGSLGRAFNLSVPNDALLSDCDEGQLRYWVGDPRADTNARYHESPGQVDQLWIGTVNGVPVVFDVFFAGPERNVVDELWIAVDHDATTFERP